MFICFLSDLKAPTPHVIFYAHRDRWLGAEGSVIGHILFSLHSTLGPLENPPVSWSPQGRLLILRLGELLQPTVSLHLCNTHAWLGTEHGTDN